MRAVHGSPTVTRGPIDVAPNPNAPLALTDILPRHAYARQRPATRPAAMAHRRRRTLSLGDFGDVFFEDRETMHYQVQEIARVEQIDDADGLRAELAVYNHLIPDGDGWCATVMFRGGLHLSNSGQGTGAWLTVLIAGTPVEQVEVDWDLDHGPHPAGVHFIRLRAGAHQRDQLRSGAPMSLLLDTGNHGPVVVRPILGRLRQALVGDLAPGIARRGRLAAVS